MKFSVREFQRAWKRDYKRLWTKSELDAGRRGFEQARKQMREKFKDCKLLVPRKENPKLYDFVSLEGELK